jgi:membrane protein
MAPVSSAEAARGRSAGRSGGSSRPGWRATLLGVKRQVSDDNLSIVAAGVAFYFLLAVFPALTAMMSLYGLVFDPQQVSEQINRLSAFLPDQAVDLLTGQLGELSGANRNALGLGFAGGLLLALWSSSVGVRKLMDALNVAYDEQEKRSFLHRTAVALLLTLGAIVIGVLAIAAIVLLPAVDSFLGLGSLLQTTIDILRWPLVAVLFALALAVLYRFGPSRESARWAWISWGAGIATVLWMVGSALFSWYVSNFASYNKSYGSMGAVVILLIWFLLCAFVTLIGAEIDSELERQAQTRQRGIDGK